MLLSPIRRQHAKVSDKGHCALQSLEPPEEPVPCNGCRCRHGPPPWSPCPHTQSNISPKPSTGACPGVTSQEMTLQGHSCVHPSPCPLCEGFQAVMCSVALAS